MTASTRMRPLALIIIFALQPVYTMDCIFCTPLQGDVQLHQLPWLIMHFPVATYKVE